MENSLTLYTELDTINKIVFKILGFSISNFEKETESQSYHASKFSLNNKSIIYRLAKNTPKKAGQFVTIWKRNDAGITEPFEDNDNFDYFLIAAKKENNFGFFIFPKTILLENKILSTKDIEGKRGIRVYPSWDQPANEQALKTQCWQSKYFIQIKNELTFESEKFKQLLNF